MTNNTGLFSNRISRAKNTGLRGENLCDDPQYNHVHESIYIYIYIGSEVLQRLYILFTVCFR